VFESLCTELYAAVFLSLIRNLPPVHRSSKVLLRDLLNLLLVTSKLHARLTFPFFFLLISDLGLESMVAGLRLCEGSQQCFNGHYSAPARAAGFVAFSLPPDFSRWPPAMRAASADACLSVGWTAPSRWLLLGLFFKVLAVYTPPLFFTEFRESLGGATAAWPHTDVPLDASKLFAGRLGLRRSGPGVGN